MKMQNGYIIFREEMSVEQQRRRFEDERVQGQIGNYLVGQNSEKQIEAYLTKLRDDAFIEIDPRFQFEGSKVKSAQIKRVPYSEENAKTRKKREKEEKKKAEEAKKTEAAEKAAATTKP